MGSIGGRQTIPKVLTRCQLTGKGKESYLTTRVASDPFPDLGLILIDGYNVQTFRIWWIWD